MKPLRRGVDARGKTIVLALEKPGVYGVWVKCQNYAAHVRGGIKTTWRYAITDASKPDATALFESRVTHEELR